MGFLRFTLYSFLGIVPWTLGFGLGGYWLGERWTVVEDVLRQTCNPSLSGGRGGGGGGGAAPAPCPPGGGGGGGGPPAAPAPPGERDHARNAAPARPPR